MPFQDTLEQRSMASVCGWTCDPDFLYLLAKRGLDVTVSLLGLIVCAPLLPLIALWIRLDSPGPVLFAQERLGYLGCPFKVYKFRTMHRDAERDGPRWAAYNDARRTRAGRVLRKLYLDELPQLLNILRGEMSLVGPRPERPEFYPACERSAPGFRRRLDVMPGLTGLAQVFQPHHQLRRQLRRKWRYDMLYIRHCSLGLDLHIIALTIGILLNEIKEMFR